MSSSRGKVSIVVAMSKNLGIGVNNKLPWRIKKDMLYFKKVTTTTTNQEKCNAVIMGRKTWDSLPEKFKPLPNRINVVVSSTLPASTPSCEFEVVRSFEDAVSLLTSEKFESRVESIYVIGGSSLYDLALKSRYIYRIYLTKVLQEFHCDVFFPSFNYQDFQCIKPVDVTTEIEEENGIQYKFCLYEKIQEKNQTSKFAENNLPIYISVAVDNQYGFGNKGSLPWPPLKKEYEHFISMVTHTQDPGKNVVFIKGRKTWLDSKEHERTLSKVLNVVISENYLAEGTCPDNVHSVVGTFEAAIDVALDLVLQGLAEKIWILGGVNVYQRAIEKGLCEKIYISKLNKTFECDTFFPQFDHKYQEIKETEVNCLDDDSHIEIKYQEFQRK